MILLLIISSSVVRAQSILDTIKVNTVQAPLTIRETGRSITILTNDQINAMPATSLDEVLQNVSGLEIQSRGGFGVQGDILMRGSTFTQVLILIDGMKLNDPLTGHFNSYIPVTLAEIERIEILRGAAAAMYGPDAVGGVINIISKTFSFQPEGLHMSGKINYGAHKLINAQQGFSLRKGKVTIGAGFSINQSEGEFFPEQFIDSTTSLTPYNNYFDLKTFGLSFSYQLNDKLRLKMRSSFDHRDFGARYFYTTSIFDKSSEIVAAWWNHLQVQRIGESGSTDINIAHKYNIDEFIFSPDFPSTNIHTSQLLNFTLNHLHRLNENVLLKGGFQIDERRIESNDRGNHNDLHFGAYVMGVYQRNSLNLTLSLRADYDENYALQYAPQLNASYVYPNIVLRASVGRNFRAADYTERYVSNNLANLTPGRSLGNPDLLAESGWSEELGLDYKLNNNWKLSATCFARQSQNLIDYVSTNQSEIGSVSEIGSLQNNENYFFAKNISNVRTNGFEFESNMIMPLSWGKQLQWNLGYSFVNTSNDDDVISVYISSHARHLFNTNLMLQLDKIDFAISGIYKQRDPRASVSINSELGKSYTVWNLLIGYKLTDNFGLNFQTQNIFNEQYQNILGARMPSRWIMGGFSWNIE